MHDFAALVNLQDDVVCIVVVISGSGAHVVFFQLIMVFAICSVLVH